MANVILQPCSHQLALEHFEHTIASKVPIREIQNYVHPEEWEKLRTLYPTGTCAVWGVEPKSGVNVSKWKRVNPGDVAFFYVRGKFIANGIVTSTTHNRRLAAHLWGEAGNRSTWEYIYFLSDIKSMATPVREFNRVIGYKLTKPVQGFSVLNENKSQLALDFFGFDFPYPKELASATRAQLIERLANLFTTDRSVPGKDRMEQNYLRKGLHGNKTENYCGICHELYPIFFLTTAHIKRRSYCSLEERINLDIAMPMCKMGCDQLFETGYISVVDGHVVPLKKRPLTAAMQTYLERIVGNECPYYTEITRPYFQWHLDFHSSKK